MAKDVILYFDDEEMMVQDYRKYLERDFDVQFHTSIITPQDLQELVVSLGPALLLQDVMMPSRDGEVDDIDAGVDSVRGVQRTLVELQIPVMFFTNRKLIELTDAIDELSFPEGCVRIFSKYEVGYRDLPKKVRDLIGFGNQTEWEQID